MNRPPTLELPVKPRVLIADDSRIVRATLIKHIQGMFKFREALDGEDAWEILLLDQSIQVVITDLTMPRLDGYGLLQRIRNSKIARIRDIPVVVVSGSDEREDRERARLAGANDVITKGIATAQLVSRLDVLLRLVQTQQDFERSLEALVRQPQAGGTMPQVEDILSAAGPALTLALKQNRNFIVLNVCLGLRHTSLGGRAIVPPASVSDAVGQLLQRSVREGDFVARAGRAEFTLAAASINFDSALPFAERICRAVAGARLIQDERISFVASCGMVASDDEALRFTSVTLNAMWDIAHRRAGLGIDSGVNGVIGILEEKALLHPNSGKHGHGIPALLRLVKEGRRAEVRPLLDTLDEDLQSIIGGLLKAPTY